MFPRFGGVEGVAIVFMLVTRHRLVGQDLMNFKLVVAVRYLFWA